MPDWRSRVDERLGTFGLPGERHAEIRDELAGHLEDVYLAARDRGHSEVDAVEEALASAGDWTTVAGAIRRAEEEGHVHFRLRTRWIPGLTSLAGAMAILLLISRVLPPALWVDPRLWVHVAVVGASLLAYLVSGAFAAWWSRRAGGSRHDGVVAVSLPMCLQLAVVVPTIAMSAFTAAPGGTSGFNPQWGVVLAGIVLPGLTLALGAAPFLAPRARA